MFASVEDEVKVSTDLKGEFQLPNQSKAMISKYQGKIKANPNNAKEIISDGIKEFFKLNHIIGDGKNDTMGDTIAVFFAKKVLEGSDLPQGRAQAILNQVTRECPGYKINEKAFSMPYLDVEPFIKAYAKTAPPEKISEITTLLLIMQKGNMPKDIVRSMVTQLIPKEYVILYFFPEKLDGVD